MYHIEYVVSDPQGIQVAEQQAIAAASGGSVVAYESAELELSGSGVHFRPFDPVAHELDSTFRLTKYSDLKG